MRSFVPLLYNKVSFMTPDVPIHLSSQHAVFAHANSQWIKKYQNVFHIKNSLIYKKGIFLIHIYFKLLVWLAYFSD